MLFRSLLGQAEEGLSGVELTPVIDIDAAVPLQRMSGKMIRWLSALAPFGQANPEPTFLSRDVEVLEARSVGQDGNHLRLKLRDGPVTWPAIAFGLGPENGTRFEVQAGQRVDVVYSFSSDRAGEGLELRVKDVAASGTGQGREARA